MRTGALVFLGTVLQPDAYTKSVRYQTLVACVRGIDCEALKQDASTEQECLVLFWAHCYVSEL